MRFWNARLHLADPTQLKMRVLLDENLSTARRSPPLSTDLLYLIVDSCFRGNGPMVGRGMPAAQERGPVQTER
jgi:hypothetical protein